ncbi:hypothetical protein SFA35_12700 [Pseudomonas sp. HR96]|uniref:hypothetical protein n=1 Tax=Pseudomonas sp. HR96 TaxID=1027966 RepID=UPI002A75A95A|nr:hypothetical protein [Pseudomonas sp. HR96]WPO97536.1 hypothetical protein SFA35_12700 [Pseudomonas sp. HR96]
MPSLKSKMRGRLAAAHGQRTNTTNNLWLCYSVKLNRDLSLASNNELIYWLADLEVNRNVKSFKFGYNIQIQVNDPKDNFKPIEAIQVILETGCEEIHHITSKTGHVDAFSATFQLEEGSVRNITYRAITEDYLVIRAKYAARLLRLLPFVAQMRYKKWPFEEETILNTLKILKSGDIQEVISSTSMSDEMIVVGIVAKFIFQGVIKQKNLSMSDFGRSTWWSLSES